jgi:hypothetical protein
VGKTKIQADVYRAADRDEHHPVAVAAHDRLQGLQPRGAGPGEKADEQGPADAGHVPVLDGCRRRNAVQLSILSPFRLDAGEFATPRCGAHRRQHGDLLKDHGGVINKSGVRQVAVAVQHPKKTVSWPGEN